jgi:uncharacterized protein
MPLLTSPIDGSPMRQIHRYGIEFDVCPTSGGVWLDKGELEKLMHLIREEVLAESGPGPAPANYGHDYDRGRGDDRHRRGYDHDDDDDDHRRGRKRSRLMDIFDF